MRFRHTGQALGFLAIIVTHPFLLPQIWKFSNSEALRNEVKKTTMLVDAVHSLMCSFWTPFFMRGIHTSNIINSISCGPKKICLHFFPPHLSIRISKQSSQSTAWRQGINITLRGWVKQMTQRRSWRQKSPSWWNFRKSWVFGLDLTKKGGWFYKLNVYLPESSKISKICWFILKRKFQSSSFIQSYPPQKKMKLVLIPMLYLVTWVTWATQPLSSSPGTVKVPFQVSRLPLHREKHRPHYLQVGKPSLRLQSQYPVNKTRQPRQHFYQTQVILREKTSLSIILLHS